MELIVILCDDNNTCFHYQVQAETTTASAKAKSMLKHLRSKSVMSFAHFLHDILEVLSRLSLELQNENSSIYMCHSQLKACMVSLEKLIER